MTKRVSDIRRLAACVRRASPRLAAAALVSSVGLAIVAPAIAYTSMRMFDAVLVSRSVHGTILWMGIEIVLAATVTALSALRQDAARLLNEPLALELTTELARKTAATPLTDLDAPEMAAQLAQARTAADNRAGELIGDLLTLLQGGISLVICAIVLALFTKLAMLIVLSCVPGALVEAASARRLQRANEGLSADRRRLQRLEQDLLSRSHRVENKFLDVSRLFVPRLRSIAARLASEEAAVSRSTRWVMLATQMLPLVTFYGIYLLLAIEVVHGRITFGALTLCLISIDNARQFSQSAQLAARNAAETSLQLRSYFAFLDLPTALRAESEAPVVLHAQRGLRCENVGYQYPGATTWALRNVDLEIGPGELIGVVGGNGSGKSTLVRLLTGLYRPTEGRITLDGRDLRDWDDDDLRARLGVVFQDFARYHVSLRENLALPATAVGDDARLREAFAASGVDEFFSDLPRGVDTELSQAFGDGAELSGGQWQKVALSRALVRRQADLLIMDEPTSALDPVSHQRVMEWVTQRRGNRTVVLITHRLAALAAAQKVVLLEKGRLSALRI